MLQQCPTSDRAKRNSHTRHCRPQTNSFCALNRINEDVGDDCKSRRENKCCTNTHGTAPKNELIACCGECCKRAADHKQHQTNLQCTLATETVTKSPAGKQQTCEDKCVRVNYPLQRSCGCIQFALQSGQSHIDDEVVDDNKEHTDGKYSKYPPTTVVRFLINSHLTVSSRCA